MRAKYPFSLTCSVVLLLALAHADRLEAARYFSRATGNWNVAANWSQLTYGGPASTTYPGQIGAGDTVLIGGHAITLTATPPNSVAAITLNHLGAAGTSRLMLNTAGTVLTTAAFTMVDNNLDQHIELQVESTALLEVNGNFLVTRSTTNNRNKRVRVYVLNNGRISTAGNFTYTYHRSNGENELEILLENSGRIDVGGNLTCTIGFNTGGGNLFTTRMDGTSVINVNGTTTMMTQNTTDGDDMLLDMNGGTFTSNGAMMIGVAATCTSSSFLDVEIDGAALNANGGLTFTQAAGANSDLLLNKNSTVNPASLYVGGNLIATHNQAAQDLTFQVNNNSSFTVEGDMNMSADDNGGDLINLDQNGGTFSVNGNLTGTVTGPGNNQGIFWTIDGSGLAAVGNNVLFSQLSGGALRILLNSNAGSNAGLTVGNDLVVDHTAGSGRFELDMYSQSDVSVGRDLSFTATFGGNNESAFIGMRNGNTFTVGRDLLMTMTAGSLNSVNDLVVREWSGTASIGRNMVFTKSAGDEAYWNQDGGTASIGGDLRYQSTGGGDSWLYLDGVSSLNISGNVLFDMAGGNETRIWLNEINGQTAQLNVNGDLTINKASVAGEVEFLQSARSQVHIGGSLNWDHMAGNDQSRYRITNNQNSMTIDGSMNCRLLAGAGTSDVFRLDCNGGDIDVGQNVLWQHAAGDDFIAVLNNAMVFTVVGNLIMSHTGGDDMLLDMNNNNTLLHVNGDVLMSDAAAGTTTTTWRMDGATRARVEGDLAMTATTGLQVLLDMNNTSYLWLQGSIVRAAAPNHFGSISAVAGSTIEFNGTGNTQLMTDDGGNGGDYVHYEKVVFNNTFGTYPQIITEGTTTIWNDIQFQNGVLGTAAGRMLVIQNGSTSNGGTATSFVDGPMKKVGNSSYTFPVGDNGFWARLGMENLNSANGSTEFDCEYFAVGSPNNSLPFYAAGVDHVSFVEHWSLRRVLDANNDANCRVRLYWESATRSAITSNSDLRVAGYRNSNSRWNSQGGTGSGGASGSILSATPFTEFWWVSFASFGGINPLPIELVMFDARPNGSVVDLHWATASELNNERFVVERSSDGLVFEPLLEQPGAINSSSLLNYQDIDRDPIPGLSYYRLRQIDLDGRSSVSDVVSVVLEPRVAELDLLIFPDPGGRIMNITLPSGDSGSLRCTMFDQAGRVVLQRNIATTGRSSIELDTMDLPNGQYVVSLDDGTRLVGRGTWRRIGE